MLELKKLAMRKTSNRFFNFIDSYIFNYTRWQKKDPLTVNINKGSLNNLFNYLTLTVTDLLFCDQANGVEAVLTGFSLP